MILPGFSKQLIIIHELVVNLFIVSLSLSLSVVWVRERFENKIVCEIPTKIMYFPKKLWLSNPTLKILS